MKRYIIKTICFWFVVLATMSCDDFLTIIPQDQQVLETYYTSEEAINANTASLYNAYIWQDFDMNFMWMAGDELAGDLYYTYSEEGQFYNMAFNNGNQFLTKGWNGLFRVVSYCNNIINGMPAVARSNGISENIVNRGLAEAYCIRGIAYYWLTEYWQDVPIITNNNISGDQVIRNTQASVYEFIRQDLEFAKDHLPITPFQAGRCSYYTATGMLAKLHLTMASHLSDANSANNFTKAKLYAAEVINNSGLKISDTNLATLFYPAGNNGSESLFAIQCITGDYGYGNGHNVSLSRNAFVNLGDAWGAGKGPTLSLQDQFETNDLRRKLTFMRNGDSYNNLGGGGYTYNNFSEDESTETSNEMLAHVRKYVIGANADCDGKAGSNGNAGNNIYLLRLADVYLCYVEACIGAGVSTSDALALDAFNQIRIRAGLTTPVTEISYDQLIKERRVEFALEGINFFDVKRMSYRDMNQGIAYLNDMHRERQYVSNGNFTWQERNANNAYHGGFTSLHPDDDPAKKGSIFYLNKDAATITITEKNLVLPIPAETLTKTPSITQEPVDYSF